MGSRIAIGPAGWSYQDWIGSVYPRKKTRRFDALSYISSYFDLVEINSTFYRVPSRATCRNWVGRVASEKNFLFTVKAFRDFTHSPDPIDEKAMNDFKSALEPILTAGRLAFVLVQFPWSFRFSSSSRSRLISLTSLLSPLPTAIEVRHGSWASGDALKFIKETGVTLCGIDQPAIGNSLTPRTYLSSRFGTYFRLHGRNAKEWFNPKTNRDMRYNYLYSSEELESWSRKIRTVALSSGLVCVVLNNHFRGQAVANALELKAMVSGGLVRVPEPLLRAFPRLQAIIREGDGDLPDGGERLLFQ